MNLVKNIILGIGLIVLILLWMIFFVFLLIYDLIFGGWRKDEEKH